MTVAADTKNSFADAWTNNQWTGAMTATNPTAVAGDGKNATVDAYRDAWAKENMGQYGDLSAGAAGMVPTVDQPGVTPEASKFRQNTKAGYGYNKSGFNKDGSYGGPQAWLVGDQKGGYGTFNYGDQPAQGTQEWRDMQEYFNWGGGDEDNLYGRKDTQPDPYEQSWGKWITGNGNNAQV